jgi:hypothetical protein
VRRCLLSVLAGLLQPENALWHADFGNLGVGTRVFWRSVRGGMHQDAFCALADRAEHWDPTLADLSGFSRFWKFSRNSGREILINQEQKLIGVQKFSSMRKTDNSLFRFELVPEGDYTLHITNVWDVGSDPDGGQSVLKTYVT